MLVILRGALVFVAPTLSDLGRAALGLERPEYADAA
jgi:hypothetical protein